MNFTKEDDKRSIIKSRQQSIIKLFLESTYYVFTLVVDPHRKPKLPKKRREGFWVQHLLRETGSDTTFRRFLCFKIYSLHNVHCILMGL